MGWYDSQLEKGCRSLRDGPCSLYDTPCGEWNYVWLGVVGLEEEENCHVTYVGGHLIHICEVEGNHGPQ